RSVMFEVVARKPEIPVAFFDGFSPQGNSPVRRIDDHRRPPRADWTVLHEPVRRAHGRPLRKPLVRVQALEGRRMVVGPDALKIGMPCRRATHGPPGSRGLSIGL